MQAASSKKVFENLETSLIYSKFRAIATRVRDQVAVISERVTEQAPEHAELLEECKKVREEGTPHGHSSSHTVATCLRLVLAVVIGLLTQCCCGCWFVVSVAKLELHAEALGAAEARDPSAPGGRGQGQGGRRTSPDGRCSAHPHLPARGPALRQLLRRGRAAGRWG